ncbi:MAG: CAP domain-containing protein [Acidobacteria bacterium]|nr:CAP domain-containing protein [Acidobacteriota bacterium]
MNNNPPTNSLTATPLDSEESTLLDLINKFRLQNGRNPLSPSISLTNAGDWMAGDMASKNYLNKIDTSGRNPSQRARVFGFPVNNSTTPENSLIASTEGSPRQVLDQWLSNAADREILINLHWKNIGVARSFNQRLNSWFWEVTFAAYWDKTIPLPGEDEEGRIDNNEFVRTRPPARALGAPWRFTGYGDDGQQYSTTHCIVESSPEFCWSDPPRQGNPLLSDISMSEYLTGTWKVMYTISMMGIVHADLGIFDRTGFNMELQINPGGTWSMKGYRSGLPASQFESGNWQAVHDASRNEEIVTFVRQNGLPRATIRIHATKDQLTFFAVDGGGTMKNFLRGVTADDNQKDDPQVIFIPKN